MRDNITKTYKESTNLKVNWEDLDAKKIADKLLISDRVGQLQKRDAYITVKDHEESFPHNPSFRLINPSKSNVGIVSKTILDRMNKEITSSIQVNQWKNFSVVIKWFRNIENKPKFSFIIFDIQEFYPSISLSLFNKAIKFVKEICILSNDDIPIIMQSRKTLLFSDGEPWAKKDDKDGFDVPVNCYDGVEVCELVGTYLLNQLKVVIAKENMGCYRDNCLGIFKNMAGPEVERNKKELVKIF